MSRVSGASVRCACRMAEYVRVDELSPAVPGKRRAGRRERTVEVPPAPAVPEKMGKTSEPTEGSSTGSPGGRVANPPPAPSGASIDVGRTLRHRWTQMPPRESVAA